MKKLRIIVLAFFTTILLVGCTNNQDKQLQQDLLKQQNTLLQQDVNQQDTNTNAPGYVTDNTNATNDVIITGSIKTIPFNAVAPANNKNTNY